MLNRYRDIIRLWSTYPALAEDLGMEPGIGPARVQKWYERDSIPPEYWMDLIAAARRRGHPGISLEVLARIAKKRAEPARDLEMAG